MLRNTCLYTVVLTSILTFGACRTASQPEQNEQKRSVAADIKAIDALRDRFAAAYNSNDAAAVAAFYADDAILMLPNQAAIEGKQAIQTTLSDYFRENAVKITPTPQETHVAGDWAFERGNIRETVIMNSGKARHRSLKYLVILKRQSDGSWKVHLDMDSSNLKGPT